VWHKADHTSWRVTVIVVICLKRLSLSDLALDDGV